MNTQKDIGEKVNKNKDIVTLGSDISNYYNVFDQNIYLSLAERSQKIVTALYMITDLMETHDPMRNLLREQVTMVMSSLFNTTHTTKSERVEILSAVNNKLFAVSSYLDVLYNNGFVSQMNYQLVSNEIAKLKKDISHQLTKSLPYDKKQNNNQSVKDFTFSADFFASSETPQRHIPQSEITHDKEPVKKDISNSDTESKKTSINSPIFVEKQTLEKTITKFKQNKPKTIKKTSPLNEAKAKRKDDILKILKQKRDASINDICALFKDCSSKTIQRDLIDLIDKGLVKKEGSRRWSKYNLTY